MSKEKLYVWMSGIMDGKGRTTPAVKIGLNKVILNKNGSVKLYFTEQGTKYASEVTLPEHFRSRLKEIAKIVE